MNKTVNPYGEINNVKDKGSTSNSYLKKYNILESLLERGKPFLLLKSTATFCGIEQVDLSIALTPEVFKLCVYTWRIRSARKNKDEFNCSKLGYRTVETYEHERKWFTRNKKFFKLVHECKHGQVWQSAAS